jgi:hypothetical protein
MGSRAESKPRAAGKSDAAFALITDALSKEPGVTFNEGKGFGSRALKVNGKIFAMMTSKDQYVVKLSKERVEELVSERVGDYFDAGKGKPMKEWLSRLRRAEVVSRFGQRGLSVRQRSLSPADT